jgi:8-oxo-dGTP pyrophosphatase MutT (NUDIX family)
MTRLRCICERLFRVERNESEVIPNFGGGSDFQNRSKPQSNIHRYLAHDRHFDSRNTVQTAQDTTGSTLGRSSQGCSSHVLNSEVERKVEKFVVAIAYYFILPYAETEAGTKILLAKRQFIQRIIGGEAFNGKTGPWPRIPDWAGQNVVIGGAGKEMEPAEEAARRLFREQTGVDLSDAQLETYGWTLPPKLVLYHDKNYNSFSVRYLPLSETGLLTLLREIAENIDNRHVHSGVLRKVSVFVGGTVFEKIGPIEPPADGWRAFLVENYFGGRQPGGFKTFTALAGDLGDDPLIVEETISPGNFVRICATTDPDTHAARKSINWEGGIIDDRCPHNCRLVPLDQETPEGQPIVISTILGKALRVEITVSPAP